MHFRKKLVGRIAGKVLIVSSLVAFCQPIVVQAEEVEMPVETENANAENIEAEAVDPPEPGPGPMEGAISLGKFQLTYYCCERYEHICGDGSGLTASGRPVEAGRSIAVDPDVIPLGSRVWIDFGDGEGWHEYSADDVGGLVKGNHIDIAVETHREALRQSEVVGQVCFIPPSENSPAE